MAHYSEVFVCLNFIPKNEYTLNLYADDAKVFLHGAEKYFTEPLEIINNTCSK